MARLFQTTSINPMAILRPQPVDAVNDTMQGYMAAEKVQMTKDAARASAEKEQYKRQQDALDRQTEGYSEMLKNPQNAEYVANQYGLPFDDTARGMLKNPAKAQLMIEGAKTAKGMGITNPEAAKAFIGSYIEKGGDFASASQATDGMELANQKLAQFGSGGIWNPQTGTIIREPQYPLQKFGSDGIWNPRTGEEIKAPTQKSSAPYRNPALPPELQMEGEMIMKSLNPTQSAIDDWMKKAGPYFEAARTSKPNQMSEGATVREALYPDDYPPQQDLQVGDRIPLPKELPPPPPMNTSADLLRRLQGQQYNGQHRP